MLPGLIIQIGSARIEAQSPPRLAGAPRIEDLAFERGPDDDALADDLDDEALDALPWEVTGCRKSAPVTALRAWRGIPWMGFLGSFSAASRSSRASAMRKKMDLY
jgi:hypothetical protein